MHKGVIIRIFVATQVCSCSTDCCAAPGQSEKEIEDLAITIKASTRTELEINDVRDIQVLEKFPEVAKLFRSHAYNALPVVMVNQDIVSYGIPDKEFILNSIGKFRKNNA
ncbi:MAG: hypothetical protein PHY94_04605 [Candidatus Omnitrophica bacterium]|nr:hypothetical protein [Candidatus Omnitrophota bacterium]